MTDLIGATQFAIAPDASVQNAAWGVKIAFCNTRDCSSNPKRSLPICTRAVSTGTLVLRRERRATRHVELAKCDQPRAKEHYHDVI